MGKAKKHLGKLACIAAFVLLLLGGVTAHAAPSNSLTVRVLDEGAPVSGMYVELVTVATEGSGGYVLDDAFTSGPRNMGDLLVDSGTDAAWDLFQYAWASNLAGNVKATSSAGNASYFGLPSGLYLVMERGNQSVTFKPYLIWLPHVVDGTPVYDVVTTPKTANTDTHTIHVTKLWDDSEDAAGARPASLEVTLSRNGAALQTVDLSIANLWQYTFQGLPNDGEYAISEKLIEGYSLVSTAFNAEGDAVIVNKYFGGIGGGGDDPPPTPTTSVAVKKEWADDGDAAGKRPSFVTVQLIKDGVVIRTQALSESSGWKHVFTGLDAVGAYTVKEVAVPDYSATYSGSVSTQVVIRNEYTSGTTDPGTPLPPEVPDVKYVNIDVKKVWIDDDDAAGKRPGKVTVHLVSDGSIVDTVIVSGDSWSHTFKDLHPFKSYSIWEEALPEYVATYSGNAHDGFMVTNAYAEGTEGDPGTPPDPSVPGEGLDDPDDSDSPDDPALPDTEGEPEIPQTGNQPLPAMLLMAAGVVLVAFGLVDLLRGRSKE